MTGAGELGYLTVGRVLRPHGVRGGLIVVPLTNQERFVPGARLALGPSRRLVHVSSSRPYKGRLLVVLDEVSSRDEAELLRRQELAIATDEIGAPPEGEVWAHELEGLAVVDPEGLELGRVVLVQENPAHDILVCQDVSGAEFMVPLVEALVDELDPASGHVSIRPIPGLLPTSEE